MLHLGRAHDAYADVEEQLGNHAQARRVRRGRGGRSLSAVSFCHHPCLTASVNCANWPNIYIYAHLTEIVKGTYWHQCQLDVDTQSLAFQATIGHCSEEKNKYAHRLSQLTSKSEFKYTSFTALQYTFPMDNVQDCKIA